jgi:hypothetical protein
MKFHEILYRILRIKLSRVGYRAGHIPGYGKIRNRRARLSALRINEVSFSITLAAFQASSGADTRHPKPETHARRTFHYAW